MPDMEIAGDTRIAHGFQGDPPLGPILGNGLRRAVFGWTHTTDTPRGYRRNIIWCWVSGNPDDEPPKAKFQLFDTSGNRAPFTGVRVYCGVASKCLPRSTSDRVAQMLTLRFRFLNGKDDTPVLVPEWRNPSGHELEAQGRVPRSISRSHRSSGQPAR